MVRTYVFSVCQCCSVLCACAWVRGVKRLPDVDVVQRRKVLAIS